MPTISRRIDPSAAADTSPNPAVNTTPTRNREVEWVKQFPLRLRTTVEWMKRFLHGGK